MNVKAHKSCVACYTYDDSQKGTIPTPCCSRFVCGSCARSKPRLAGTCILCQLPIPQDLAQPSHEELPGYDDSLPTYESNGAAHNDKKTDEKHGWHDAAIGQADEGYKEAGVQHFVRKEDSIASLSLAYRVPAAQIRKANHIFSDSLLQGRSFVVIPGATKSLSASPGEDEIEKVKLKKFMVAVKCTDYDMAKTYMKECEYRVSEAVERYTADSQWTREHAKDTGRAGPSGTTKRK